MRKIRSVIVVVGMLSCSAAYSDVQVSIGLRLPHASIALNLPAYPELVVVPGYPVYYAPRLEANYFFYDGMYWVYENENWYSSNWYNGPWWLVDREAVPVFVLRIPVGYYRRPPAYFHGWRGDAPPRWSDHWGRDWERRRSGWDRWDHSAAPAPAPLPIYQRQYSGDRYPRRVEQQQELRNRNYRYQPHDPVVRQYYEQRAVQAAPAPHSQSPRRGGEDVQRSTPAPSQHGRPSVKIMDRRHSQSWASVGSRCQDRMARWKSNRARTPTGNRNGDTRRNRISSRDRIGIRDRISIRGEIGSKVGNALMTEREVAPHCECQGDGRVQVRSAHGAHEVDDRHHHEPRRNHDHAQGNSACAHGGDHPATRGDKNQQERAPSLGKETTPLVRRVQKVGGNLALNHPQLLHGVMPESAVVFASAHLWALS